jgi:hypothetical protein
VAGIPRKDTIRNHVIREKMFLLKSVLGDMKTKQYGMYMSEEKRTADGPNKCLGTARKEEEGRAMS